MVVPFAQYIKNVASHEIYPTWPESAIRANILAQISYALNRVYTEYYRSRGYDFDITSTTRYDQAYVEGGDIFENISRIVDDIFNNYIVRQGSVEPPVRPVLRRGAYPVQWPVPMGQRGSGGGGHDALRNFAVLLRRRHQSGDECAGGRERGLLFGAAPAAGRCRATTCRP